MLNLNKEDHNLLKECLMLMPIMNFNYKNYNIFLTDVEIISRRKLKHLVAIYYFTPVNEKILIIYKNQYKFKL